MCLPYKHTHELPLLKIQVQKTKEQYNNQHITAQNLVTQLHVI